MHPSDEARPARRMLFLIAVMLAFALLPSPSMADDFPTGPGLDWTLPESHGLFIAGAEGTESLERNRPSETGQLSLIHI